MEFVEGGTLHEYIQISDMLSEDTVRHIIRQMLSALEYMHEYVRVSHRDLKPAVHLFMIILIIEHSFMQSRRATYHQNCRSRSRQDRCSIQEQYLLWQPGLPCPRMHPWSTSSRTQLDYGHLRHRRHYLRTPYGQTSLRNRHD